MAELAQTQDDAPDVDHLFPPDQAQDVDALFPASVEHERKRRNLTGASPMQDFIFGDTSVSPMARVLDAFGQGAKDNWGASRVGLAEESDAFLKKSGMYNDYQKGEHSLIKAANEAIVRPAVNSLVGVAELGFRGASAIFSGAQGAAAQLGAEVGAPKLGREIAAIPEAMPTGFHSGMPHVTFAERAATFRAARDVKVVSPGGEAAWKGTIESPEVPQAEHAEAIAAQREAAAAQPQPTGAESHTLARQPDMFAPDLHATVRETAPETFNEYDALTKRRDTYNGWINEFADEPKAAEVVATLREKVAEADKRLHELAPEVSKAYQGATAQAILSRPEVKEAVEAPRQIDRTHDVPYLAGSNNEGGVTYIDKRIPESIDVKGKALDPAEPLNVHEQTEHALMVKGGMPYEAAHKIATAKEHEWIDAHGYDWAEYEKVMDGYIGETEHEIAKTPPPDLYTKPYPHKEAEALAREGAAAAPAAPVAPVTSPTMLKTIADDVTRKLVAAGRPQDESAASAAIIAAHYEARAMRFEGRKGTAAELYEREAPDITKEGLRGPRSGGGMAPGGTPRKPTGGPAARPVETRSLLEELTARGGLKPNGELATIFGGKNKFVPGYGSLLREDGMSLDEALDTAKGSGHMFDVADVEGTEAKVGHNELLNLIDREARGEKQYVIGHERETKVDSDKELHTMESALDSGLEEVGVDPKSVTGKIRDRTLELMQKEGVSDPLEAYEQAVMEDINAAEYEAGEALRPGPIKDWDVPDDLGPVEADRGTPPQDRPGGASETRGESVEGDREAELESEFAQDKRGKIRFRGTIGLRDEGKPLITLFKDANASTFIHETGHQWLEELVRDAREDDAPDGLKADAKAVYDWLGVEKPEDIKSRHHERFARGFETYIMEGRAPTQALASVFAKFKAWLTRIYQTVQALRSPISDDIRAVFDRLVAHKPEDVVIAPERETASGFADLHEADAESAAHPAAHDVAETIQAERDAAATASVPEDHDARLANTPDEARSREAGSPQPDRDGHAAEPVPGETGNPPQPAALGAGGSEAAGQGAGAPAQRGSAVASEVPAGPNVNFGARESEYVDKAGNIRLDKLNGPEGFDIAIRDAAERNAGFITERRGVISDGQALDLADAMGTDPAFLDFKKIGSAYNQQEIIVIRRMLVQSATAVRDAMAKAATGTDAEVMELGKVIARHEMIQAKVAGATAEAGRALRAFNMPLEGVEAARDINQFLKDNTGRTLFQLKEMARYGQRLQTPSQVSKFVKDTSEGKLRRAIVFYYVNALISGPITHTRYSIGNAINALWTPLVEIPFAAATGAFRERVGLSAPGEQRVYLGEAGAQLYAITKGSRDGFRAAIDAFVANQSAPLPMERVSAHFADAPVTPIPGAIGQAISVPGRSVAAIHSFFKSLRYEQNIAGQAYRVAMSEGLEGDAFHRRVGQLSQSPTEAMMTSATGDALKELFMAPTDYHSPFAGLVRFTNQNLLAKIVVPFMKIGSQITRNALIERTPLGVFDHQVRANLSGANGPAAREMQTAKIATGVGLMGATALLAAEGLATGDGPDDPKERQVWLLNHTPNSIQIGDLSLKYQGLGHLGMLMRLSANTYETAKGWGEHDDYPVALSFLHGVEKAVLDENFMRGVKDMLDALYHYEEYGQRYMTSLVTNWIPFSVGLSQVAREIDPYQRETYADNTIDAIFKSARAKIPFLSQTLHPRRDMFGEPIPSSGKLPQYQNDKVVQAMDGLGAGIGRLEHKIRGVPLTDQQYDDFARMSGRMAKIRLNAIIGPNFGQIPRAIQIDMINKTVASARNAARSIVMMQSAGTANDIIKQATQAKIDDLRE